MSSNNIHRRTAASLNHPTLAGRGRAQLNSYAEASTLNGVTSSNRNGQQSAVFENNTNYVGPHLRDYKNDCAKKQQSYTKSSGRHNQSRMDDVSTVNGSQMPGGTYDNCDIYKNYSFNRSNEAAKKLPIYGQEKQILTEIDLYDVIVIEGQTGCGKSTQVAQFILDNAASKKSYANIVVTQPRKMAAIMLANRVASERNWHGLCSYQVGLDNQTSPDTRITYMTTEVLVQKIIRQKSLNEYTHILLDEVHERDCHTDFALLIVKKLLYLSSDRPKIILMSATIDAMKFSRYFSIPSGGYTIPAPIISVTMTKGPDYQIFYHDYIKNSISPFELQAWKAPPEASLMPDMVDLCLLIIRKFDNFERGDDMKRESSQLSKDRKGVLVFLPGLWQIEVLINRLREIEEEIRLDILPLHSSITKAEQNRVNEPARLGYRKIIVSTNIAESSLTISDVSYVIDFCLTKTLSSDLETNYTSLKLAWASQASCKQRAGRVGRVGPGRVFRLVSKKFYESLPEFGTPELIRTPLSESVLKVKMLDLGEPQALLALALDPPNLREIHRTILELKQIGALSVKFEGIVTALDGDLTFLGMVASNLPLDVRVSKLIVFGYLFGCFKQTIIIAAGLSMKNMFSRPFQKELPAHMGKISFAEESHSDCIAILNAYNLWTKAKAEGGFNWAQRKERQWAQKQFLQLDVLREMSKLINELTRRLENNGLKHNNQLTIHDSTEEHLMLKMCIAAAFYPYYFKQLRRKDDTLVKNMSGLNPLSSALILNLPRQHSNQYEAQLQEIFRPCSHDLQFSFVDNRAIMQLVNQAKPGVVECRQQDANSVIIQLMLKMRQVPRLSDTLCVRVIKELLPLSNPNAIDRRIVPSAMVPAPHVIDWDVFITHVENADHFWVANVTSLDCEYDLSVTHIEGIIREELPTCRNIDTLTVTSKTYCLAPFLDGNATFYYRGRIDSVRPATAKNERIALVFFLDYGNSVEIAVKKLKTMPDELYDIPQLAIECRLSGVQPISPADMHYGRCWPQAAFEYTNKTINYSMHVCQIYSISNNVAKVKLFVKNRLLNDTLIEMDLAKFCDEPEESKMNFKLRQMSNNTGSRQLESMDVRQSMSFGKETKAKEHYDIVLSDQTHRFRGPCTTLEMTFRGMSPALYMHGMNIEMDSVNSTALDLDYDNKHSKFIVAAFLSMNSSQTKIIARNTTLLPGIPGLMEYCLLMFAPIVELRINADQTGYSGAIVGLGIANEVSYKKEDMELEFDFEFTHADILSINEVRNCLNNSLNDLYMGYQTKIRNYQLKLQETIKNLILQNRVYQKPESFRNSLQWGCIPLNKTIVATLEEKEERPPIFALLNHAKLSAERDEEAIRAKVFDLYQVYSDLGARKVSYDYELDEYCILCDVAMSSYSDMHEHMSKRNHVIKEDTALGLR